MVNDLDRKRIISELVKASAAVQTAYSMARYRDDHGLSKQLWDLGEDIAAAIGDAQAKREQPEVAS